MALQIWLRKLCASAAVLVLIWCANSPAQNKEPTYRDSYGFEAVEIRLEHRKETWTIRREKGGIAIVVKTESGERIVRPAEFQGIGSPIRVAATKLEYEVEPRRYLSFVGLAVECERADRKNLEYRMALSRSSSGPENWSLSEPLAVRAADNPFHTIGVGIPGGDSIMMTLQSLNRGEAKDSIETELFVNHCPFGTPMIGGPSERYKFQPIVVRSGSENLIPTSAPSSTTKPGAN